MTQLESLSGDVFAPLSRREASLVVGGMAAGEVIGVTYVDCITLFPNGTWLPDVLFVDTIEAI